MYGTKILRYLCDWFILDTTTEHIHYDSKLLVPVVCFAELVWNWFIWRLGRVANALYTQILPRPARKELNVLKLKSSWGLTVLILLPCPSLMQPIRSHYIYRTVGNLLRALDTGNWVVHYTRDFCIMGTKSASFGRQIPESISYIFDTVGQTLFTIKTILEPPYKIELSISCRTCVRNLKL